MIKTILLDLDDVLNRFTMPCLHQMGCDVDPNGYDEYPSALGWDIVGAYNYFSTPERMMNDREFWTSTPKTLWAEAPLSPQFQMILNNSRDIVGEENVFIVTSPTRCPASASGKLEWIQEHMPRAMHRNFAITPNKHLMAAHDVLLIDDSDSNCQKFRAAGGQAWVCPRPWNTGHRLDTTETLNYLFRSLE